ncbi:MAG: AAA family ATPase, partial [Candidatus Phytoplasma australasiaticum]|nr:AAA family ATPase [Candidatus Phytoplasma australasiaticum]
MSLNKKIYFSLLGLLSSGLLLLLIFGITHTRFSTKNPSLKNQISIAQSPEIDHQIQLEQAKIRELQQQDYALKNQIAEHMQTLTETINKIKTLQTELTNNP